MKNEIVEIRLWGTTIGHLGYTDQDKHTAIFEFDKKILNSSIDISPLKMTNKKKSYHFRDISFRTFKGIPGVFSDSLPDKFGSQLIDQFMAQKNIPEDKITTLDRLLYVGTRAMGALEYHPSINHHTQNTQNVLDIELLSELAELALQEQKKLQNQLNTASTKQDVLNLIKIGSSAGGARAKALVAQKSDNNFYDGTILYNEIDTKYWLLKFDTSSNSDRDKIDPKGMTKVEYIYSLIAKGCGINMPNTAYIKLKDDFHFLIERFDRIINKDSIDKLHYISWAGLSHYDRDSTGAYSYEQLVLNIRQLRLGQDAVTEIFKRAVFNIIGRNQDDHTKNFGFLMDRKGRWTLAPAFDMTYSFDPTGTWTRVHQISCSKKQDNFTRDDIITFGKFCNLNKSKALNILDNTLIQFKKFEQLSTEYQLDEKLKITILKNLRLAI